MNSQHWKNAPITKQIILVLLIAALIVNCIFLVYELVYAGAESHYKKDILIIGIWFIVLGRFTISFYKSAMNK